MTASSVASRDRDPLQFYVSIGELQMKDVPPSSLCEFLPLLRDRTHCLILDRDGTLVPITNDPDRAVLSASTTAVINDLAQLLEVPLIIVSARGLNTLRREFDPDSLVLAGNYGLEISFPSGLQFVHPQAHQSKAEIFAVFQELNNVKLLNPSLFLDNHELSLCLHMHNLPENEMENLHPVVHQLQSKYSSLHFRRLSTSYEILPALEWTKASALDKISSELSLNTKEPLYISFGDSDADEPMFQWTNQRNGMSFNVGKRTTTDAQAALETPHDVTDFLTGLAQLIRSSRRSIQCKDS